MSTLMANGFIVTQHTDHNVSISRNGRDIVRLKFSRELSGEELSELAFWIRNVLFIKNNIYLICNLNKKVAYFFCKVNKNIDKY